MVTINPVCAVLNCRHAGGGGGGVRHRGDQVPGPERGDQLRHQQVRREAHLRQHAPHRQRRRVQALPDAPAGRAGGAPRAAFLGHAGRRRRRRRVRQLGHLRRAPRRAPAARPPVLAAPHEVRGWGGQQLDERRRRRTAGVIKRYKQSVAGWPRIFSRHPPQTSLASHPSLSCSVPSHTSSPDELLPQRLQSWRPLARCCRCSLGQLHWSRHPPMVTLFLPSNQLQLVPSHFPNPIWLRLRVRSSFLH